MTGWSFYEGYMSHSEIIDLSETKDSQCSNWAEYPYEATGGTGGLIGGTPIICGGLASIGYDQVYDNRCYSIVGHSAEFVTNVSIGRYEASSVVLNEEVLWIVGGKDQASNVLSSTEYVTLEGSNPGPDMPTPLYDHVIIGINSTYSILVGGAVVDWGDGGHQVSYSFCLMLFLD